MIMDATQIATQAKKLETKHRRNCPLRADGDVCSHTQRLAKIREAAQVIDENEMWIRRVILTGGDAK